MVFTTSATNIIPVDGVIYQSDSSEIALFWCYMMTAGDVTFTSKDDWMDCFDYCRNSVSVYAAA